MNDFLLNLLPTLAGVVLGACYVPQIIKTVKTKNVDGMSVQFWVLLNIALTMLLINSIVVFINFGTWGYMVTEIFNEGLALVMLILVLKYRKK